MALKYGWIIILIIVFLLLTLALPQIIWRSKKIKRVKIANTTGSKMLAEYKRIRHRYQILLGILISCLLGIIFGAGLLSARFSLINAEESIMDNRDVVLCFDVSQSMDKAVQALSKEFKRLVIKLQGERIALSIFNTTSVLVVPLTDDYHYLNQVLTDVEKAFTYSINELEYGEYSRLQRLITQGTMENSDIRGGSLIGDGLASCVYAFGNLGDQTRSRSIILATDNEVYGQPLVTVMQAAKICKDNDIRVYGINPFGADTTKKINGDKFKEFVNFTGGRYYILNEPGMVSEIVSDIENQEKSIIVGTKQIVINDAPLIPYIVLLGAFCLVLLTSRQVKL